MECRDLTAEKKKEALMLISRYEIRLDNNRLPQMVKEASFSYAAEQLMSPEVMVDMLNSCFYLSDMAEEHVYVISLTSKMKPLAVFDLSHGTVACAPVDAREVFTRALLSGAAGIVLAHNHPSGDPAPSGADIEACNKIVQASELMHLPVLDFIIVGDRCYYSFKDKGMIK